MHPNEIDSINQPWHIGARNDWPELISIINKGLDAVTEAEKKSLHKKWLGEDEQRRIQLTEEEKRFIDAHPRIKIHMEEDYIPFSFVRGGELKGYSIDFAELIAKKLGVEFVYLTKQSWNEAISKLKSKEIDVIGQMINTEKRRRYTLFTDTYMKYYTGISVKIENAHLNTLEALEGKKLAIINGYAIEDVVKKHYPMIEIFNCDDNYSCLNEVSQGKVDAFLSTYTVMQYLISEHDLFQMTTFSINDNPLFAETKEAFGIRNDWPLFHSAMQKAINDIEVDEKQRIFKKWFGLAKQAKPKIQLTHEEKAFLENHPIIKVSNEMDWPPFDFVIGKEPKGYSIDLIKMIAERIGIKLEFINGYTWNELFEKFKKKEIDIVHPVYHISYRERVGLFSKTIFVGRNVYVTQAESPKIRSIEDLKEKIVAVVKGWATEKFLKDEYPEIELLLTNNLVESLKAISMGQAYATIEMDAVAGYYLIKEMRTDLKINGWFKEFDIRRDNKLYYLIRKDWPILQQIFIKAQESIKPQELAALQKSWFGASKDEKTQLQLIQEEKEKDRVRVVFSDEEQAYLDRKGVIKFSVDPFWPPFEYIDEKGQFRGIMKDYLHLFHEISNIEFKLMPTNSWKETLELVRTKKCDLIPQIAPTPEREAAVKRYRSFVKKGLSESGLPDLSGGGLVRSACDWTELKAIRKTDARIKGDERILGNSEFVVNVLNAPNEKFEEKYALKAGGYDFKYLFNTTSIQCTKYDSK